MISRRILGLAALVLSTVAIAAPAAQATFRDYGPVAQQDGTPVVIDRRPIVIESGAFDWADAGIGAAAAAGLVLIGGGAELLARRGRRGQIATSE
jgi:hypothetical protein